MFSVFAFPLPVRHRVFALALRAFTFLNRSLRFPPLRAGTKAMKTKPRVAIYARYSSEIQSPLSISGQIALCRRLIEREFDVDGGLAAVFSDAEITGRTVLGHPGLQLLLEAAERKEFDVVVAEDLSRFSRTLRDTDEIYERLEHRGVALYTAHEGWVSQIDIGFKGTMNAIFLTDMKAKVRRGQRACAEEGRIPSSCAYGYRVVRGVVDGRNRNVNGLREIDPEEAKVVRRIFEEYAAGKPIKAIVRDLNGDGIASPRGASWRPVSIKGPAHKAGGIVRNELYRGVLVFNRIRRVMDPVTRRSREEPNPESEWTRTSVPHLRIVADELWNKAQIRIRKGKLAAMPGSASPRKSGQECRRTTYPYNIRPLMGLVRCGHCGGEANLANRQRYVCAAARFTGACRNTRGVRVPELVGVIFPALRKSVARVPDLFAEVDAFLKKERERQAALKKEAADLDGCIKRFFDLFERGLLTEYSYERLRNLEKKRAAAEEAVRKVPRLPSSDSDIRPGIDRALTRMEMDFLVQSRAWYLKEGLSLVVEKIVLTPVEHKRSGSTIEVWVRPEGWPAFWQLMKKANIPGFDGRSSGRSAQLGANSSKRAGQLKRKSR